MFLIQFLVIVSSSELPAFEHRKLWCVQTLCWLHGERSLPIGLLVFVNLYNFGLLFEWPLKTGFTVFKDQKKYLEFCTGSLFRGEISLCITG